MMNIKRTILFFVLFPALSVAPGPAAADKISEIEAQVQKLTEQLASVQSELKSLRDEQAEMSSRQIPAAGGGIKGPDITIGGQYRIMGNSSDFSWHPASLPADPATQSFFNQRFRTWLTVSPSDEVSGYVETEIGHITWGRNYEWTKTYAGPSDVPGSDRVGIELRRGYLTYKPYGGGRFRAGIQDWGDRFDDTLASSLWDFNAGGIEFSKELDSMNHAKLRMGVFEIWEGDTGKASVDTELFAGDIDLPAGDESSVGFSAYYLNDSDGYSYPAPAAGYTANYLTGATSSSYDYWLGARASTVLDPLKLNGFLIYNKGEIDGPNWKHDGYAAKLEAGYEFSSATFGLQALYSTGDDDPSDNASDEFRTIAQSERDNFGSQGYWSYLGLTSPRGSSDVQDLGVGLQNRGFGLTTLQANLEFPVAEDVGGYLAAGWFKSSEDNSSNGNDRIGTELLAELNFGLAEGLVLDVGAAYLFTGDFYKASAASASPDDLFELYTRLQLEF